MVKYVHTDQLNSQNGALRGKAVTRRFQHFIGGQSVAPNNGDWIDSKNPATGAVWAQFARGNTADVAVAVKAANTACNRPDWRDDSANRSAVLHAIADHLDKNFEQLIEVEINDNGKRIREVRAQMAGLGGWYRHFAMALADMQVEKLSLDQPGVSAHLELMPFGVVGAITAWNSPLMIAAWKVAPALAAGNAVIIKPSEMASASSVVFAELLAQVVPNGLINVITGYGHEAGAAIVAADAVRKVTFTGSEIGGAKVAGTAAEHVKPVTLELGGKSPQIVFADADLENALNGVLSGIFLSNGQTCVAGSRLIIHNSIRDDFLQRLQSKLESLRYGDPLRDDTDIGPIANKPQFDKILAMLDRAKQAGADILAGGHKVTVEGFESGFFIAPTILQNVATDSEIWQEEVFGPVLCVNGFETTADAIDMANDSHYGLAAGVWTGDAEFAKDVASKVQAGTVYINHYRSVSACAPVGGIKRSGYGRELGPNAIRDFMQEKAVWHGNSPMPDPFHR
jgi:acyl-CoA reductase-like NAD-dependent aldehyde dehydrogenase